MTFLELIMNGVLVNDIMLFGMTMLPSFTIIIVMLIRLVNGADFDLKFIKSCCMLIASMLFVVYIGNLTYLTSNGVEEKIEVFELNYDEHALIIQDTYTTEYHKFYKKFDDMYILVKKIDVRFATINFMYDVDRVQNEYIEYIKIGVKDSDVMLNTPLTVIVHRYKDKEPIYDQSN